MGRRQGRWLANLIARHGLTREEAAAVGDSWRDVPMFDVVRQRFYVGDELPGGIDALHVRDGDSHEIARRIVAVT